MPSCACTSISSFCAPALLASACTASGRPLNRVGAVHRLADIITGKFFGGGLPLGREIAFAGLNSEAAAVRERDLQRVKRPIGLELGR